MRFHVVALPHTITGHPDFSACAYTGKIARWCRMMTSLGHEVFHYGAEGSHVDAEHVSIITREEQEKFFGVLDRERSFLLKWDPTQPYWRIANERAAAAINRRKQMKDFVCLVGGTCHKPLADMVGEQEVIICEPFVGYYGISTRYRVFESYTHQAAVYGTRSSDPDGCLYDAVIPNYYDPEEFPLVEKKEDYLLYVGRLIRRKGLQIVLDVAKRTGRRLILAGQGVKEKGEGYIVTEEGLRIEVNHVNSATKDGCCQSAGCPGSVIDVGIHYAGTVDAARRAKLMGEAHCLLLPTLYCEPFGGTAVEAQLCGTPAITTDHAAFSETVKHGFSGYRCHTLEQFCWAVENVNRLASPQEIRERAVRKYSMDNIRWMYWEYFEMLSGLWGAGWYGQNQERGNLDWLSAPGKWKFAGPIGVTGLVGPSCPETKER